MGLRGDLIAFFPDMFCPSCGEKAVGAVRFCRKCGKQLPSAEPVVDGFETLRVPVQQLVKTEELSNENTTEPQGAIPPPDDKARMAAVTEVLHVSDFIEDDSTDEDLSRPIVAPEDIEMSKVFEDAESLLDDLFIERPQGGLQIADPPPSPFATRVDEPAAAQPEPSAFEPPPAEIEKPAEPLPISDPEAEIEQETQLALGRHPSVADAIRAEAPTENTAGRQEKKKTRWGLIAAGLFAVLLILGAVAGFAIWYFIVKPGPIAISNTNAETPPSTPPPTPPTIPDGMVLVAGGEFMMGSDRGDEYSRPPQKMTVASFYIDIYEVTNEEYKKFVDQKSYKPPQQWTNGEYPAGQARFPVTGVNWEDANAYAAWAGKRLPTEAEWEFAARGNDGRMYPWGENWDPKMANAAGQVQAMQEVGKRPGKSPFGAFDMAGNAWEWTASDAAAYPGGKEFVANGKALKVIRGGFWGSDVKVASSVGRRAYGASGEPEGYPNTGIRCAKSLEK